MTDAKKQIVEQQSLVQDLLKTAQTAPVQKEPVPVKKEPVPVKKSDSMVVVYLPKKIEGRGPGNGSRPGPVAKIERRVELSVLYPEIERALFQVQLKHPRGNKDIDY